MKQARALCLALNLCLLVTLPLSSVRAEFTCDPLSSLRTQPALCGTSCIPPPTGPVVMVDVNFVFPAGTCTVENDLTVTLTGGTVFCFTTITFCQGGTVVPLVQTTVGVESTEKVSVESADSSAESAASVDSSAESAASVDSSAESAASVDSSAESAASVDSSASGSNSK